MPAPKDPNKLMEWKEKLSIRGKNPNKGQFKKGNIPKNNGTAKPRFCIVCSLRIDDMNYTRKTCSKSCSHIAYSKSKLGDKNPLYNKHPQNFNNYSSLEPYGSLFNEQFKNKIRNKFNFRCQQCFRHQDELRTSKNRKYKLHIHHIDYNKKNNDEKNLIPLCRCCHMQTNFKRGDWVNYFKNKMEMI